MGDFGVVVANDKVIPVIVADIGPTNKIGEGSAALLSRLAKEGQAHTLAEGVRYIVFPGTSLTREVNADKLALEIGKKIELYERLLLP
ncbi:chitosanase of glycosyl hydrolase group 75 [Cupriavidus sp. YR651]|nr:chitosanase of glycosyl hydrolase group 75 [Cupriavidus sp. YR651]